MNEPETWKVCINDWHGPDVSEDLIAPEDHFSIFGYDLTMGLLCMPQFEPALTMKHTLFSKFTPFSEKAKMLK